MRSRTTSSLVPLKLIPERCVIKVAHNRLSPPAQYSRRGGPGAGPLLLEQTTHSRARLAPGSGPILLGTCVNEGFGHRVSEGGGCACKQPLVQGDCKFDPLLPLIQKEKDEPMSERASFFREPQLVRNEIKFNRKKKPYGKTNKTQNMKPSTFVHQMRR